MKKSGSYDIEDMIGLRKKMPFISLAMFIGIVTIVLPPFGIFASKWLISEASVSAPIIAFLLAAGFTAISVFYFKWLGNILTDSEDSEGRGLKKGKDVIVLPMDDRIFGSGSDRTFDDHWGGGNIYTESIYFNAFSITGQ